MIINAPPSEGAHDIGASLTYHTPPPQDAPIGMQGIRDQDNPSNIKPSLAQWFSGIRIGIGG
jgi:hypothetical protein